MRKLDKPLGGDIMPAWSPNGKRLAVESESKSGNPDIYVMNADGSGLMRITKDPTSRDQMTSWSIDGTPSWSPEGTRIAFSRVAFRTMFSSASASASAPSTQTGSNHNGIYTVGVDGMGLRRLTDDAHDEFPAWSPDGKRIAFDRLTKPAGVIYTVKPDGSGLRRLTDPPKGLWDTEPSWSPDGTKIVFARGDFKKKAAVYVMNADGTHLSKLTGKSVEAYSPDVSPDGKRIVYVGWKRGIGSRLYVMNSDGTNIRQLTETHSPSFPDWQPLP